MFELQFEIEILKCSFGKKLKSHRLIYSIFSYFDFVTPHDICLSFTSEK